MLYKNCSHVSKVSRKLNESKELRVQIFKSQYKQQKIVLNTVFRTCGLMFIFMHFIHRSFQANSHLQNNSAHSSIPSQRVTLHQTTAEPETNLYDLGTTISLHLGKKKKETKNSQKKCKCQQTKTFSFLQVLRATRGSSAFMNGDLRSHRLKRWKATSHLVTPCGLNSAASIPANKRMLWFSSHKLTTPLFTLELLFPPNKAFKKWSI